MDLHETIQGILEKGYLMSIATLDDGGVWVSDVIYVFDDEFNLYWMSDPDVRHSKAMLKNNLVSGTVTINGPGKENLGIQFSGQASKIDGVRYDLAQKHFAKRGKDEPKEEDDILEGDSWYVLKPDFFDIIDESQWGFEKKKFKF